MQKTYLGELWDSITKSKEPPRAQPEPYREWVYEKCNDKFALDAKDVFHDLNKGIYGKTEYWYRYELCSGERELLIIAQANNDEMCMLDWIDTKVLPGFDTVYDYRITSREEIATIAEVREAESLKREQARLDRDNKLKSIKLKWAEIDKGKLNAKENT